MSHIRIGISGWVYPPWRGAFYPQGLKQKDELAYAAQRMQTIEINGTFYSLKKPEHFQGWASAVPSGFPFAIKGSRYITHILAAKDTANTQAALANFFASGLLGLGPQLGPILWQFPPSLTLNDDRFAAFFQRLPKTFAEATALAKQHDDKVKGRALVESPHQGPIRHACEFRHESFYDREFLQLMQKHNIAVVIAEDGKPEWPQFCDLTADFIYMRMHGLGSVGDTGYSLSRLESLAEQLRFLAAGHPFDAQSALLEIPEATPRDVYVYFDNDAKAMSPRNAMELIELLE